MSSMNWKEAIQHWRKLPDAKKHTVRWGRIPRNVVESMAFEGEPVDMEMLEAEHARQPMPPDTLKPDKEV